MLPEYKDIAVFLDSSPRGRQIGSHAAMLARRYNAHLIGIYGLPQDDRAQDGSVRGPAIRAWLERRRQTDENNALAAGRTFADLSRTHAISSEFRLVWRDGMSEQDLLRGLHCDLIVSAHPKPDDLPDGWSGERLLLSMGTPVLIIPETWPQDTVGNNVLIAWNRSREARRAVADSMPFLYSASRVTILVVDGDRNSDYYGEMPGTNLCDHLSRHGVVVEVAHASSEGAPMAQAIADASIRLGADLLVFGAYSRPRTQEFLFGGTTRSLLARAPVPMLISR